MLVRMGSCLSHVKPHISFSCVHIEGLILNCADLWRLEPCRCLLPGRKIITLLLNLFCSEPSASCLLFKTSQEYLKENIISHLLKRYLLTVWQHAFLQKPFTFDNISLWNSPQHHWQQNCHPMAPNDVQVIWVSRQLLEIYTSSTIVYNSSR